MRGPKEHARGTRLPLGLGGGGLVVPGGPGPADRQVSAGGGPAYTYRRTTTSTPPAIADRQQESNGTTTTQGETQRAGMTTEQVEIIPLVSLRPSKSCISAPRKLPRMPPD